MSYETIPGLIAITCLAGVLTQLRRRQHHDLLPLWVAGLTLIVLEGFARVLYLLPLSASFHKGAHVVALDAYFLAGVAFFQSGTGRLRYLKHGDLYLAVCVAPHLVLLTCYGAGVIGKGLYMGVCLSGLLASLTLARILRRSSLHVVCHAAIWLPICLACFDEAYRQAVYTSLFFVYAAAAIAFVFALPNSRWGRLMIVSSFSLWALSFLVHPWIAEHHKGWQPLAQSIWDLQKFFVTFGMLLGSLEEDNAENEYNALHDRLTGLANRSLLRDRFEQAIAREARTGRPLVLFNIDLNGFKQVNDTYGHEVGDELLLEVSRRLQSVVRGSDTLARVGGDEFHVLVSDLNQAVEGPRSYSQLCVAPSKQSTGWFAPGISRVSCGQR